jgi:outer membrane lipoprotein-sorting protein
VAAAVAVVLAVAAREIISVASRPQSPSTPPEEWLARAVRAPLHLNYRATETLTTAAGRRTQRQVVRVVHRAPDDTRREYLSDRGRVTRIVVDDDRGNWQYSPERREVIFSPSLRVDRELWQERELKSLLSNYALSSAGFAAVAGRRAQALTISPRRGHRGPSKRLWVDDGTGLILQSELTGADGNTKLTSSLSDLQLPTAISSAEFTPPPSAKKQTVIREHVVVLPLPALARHWKYALLAPEYVPAGYSLESARVVRRGQHRFVHLRYFDGLNTISLFEEPVPARDGETPGRRGEDREREPSMSWHSSPPLWWLTWRDEGLKLTLVSDLPRDELLRIARSVSRAAAVGKAGTSEDHEDRSADRVEGRR